MSERGEEAIFALMGEICAATTAARLTQSASFLTPCVSY
jgi:hypothetical protein